MVPPMGTRRTTWPATAGWVSRATPWTWIQTWWPASRLSTSDGDGMINGWDGGCRSIQLGRLRRLQHISTEATIQATSLIRAGLFPATRPSDGQPKQRCGALYPGDPHAIWGCIGVIQFYKWFGWGECIRIANFCCWGLCQFYERWCIDGAKIPPGDPRRPFWRLTVQECRDCADKCTSRTPPRWTCFKGGGRRGPRWPKPTDRWEASWPDDEKVEVEVCRKKGGTGVARQGRQR